MTAHVTAGNVGPVAEARMELVGPIVGIFGRNDAGKTTLVRCLRAALAGVRNPVGGTLKSGGPAMVGPAHDIACVDLTDSDGRQRSVVWPKCELTETIPPPPFISEAAAGLHPFDTTDPKDRARHFAATFDALPTEADLVAAMEGAEAPKLGEEVDRTVKLLSKLGWDGAEVDQRKAAKALKGMWENTTGANYGSKVASRWRATPEAPPPDLPDLVEIQERLATATAEVEQAQGARDALGPMPAEHHHAGLVCPGCKMALRVEDGSLVAQGPPPDAAKLRGQREAIAAADGALRRLTGERATIEREVVAAEAVRQYSSTKALEAAEELTGRARSLHQQIETALAVADILAPTGLRQAKLGEALAMVNDELAAVCRASGWLLVQVTPDLEITYGGRPFSVASGSGKWRARALLQIAIARQDGSQYVILDEADVCDRTNREALFKVLKSTGVTAIVAMTIGDRKGVPDLAAAGYGLGYWINAGKVERIGA